MKCSSLPILLLYLNCFAVSLTDPNNELTFTEQSASSHKKKYVMEEPKEVELSIKEKQKMDEEVDQINKKKKWQLNAGLYVEGSKGDQKGIDYCSDSDDDGKKFWIFNHGNKTDEVVQLNLNNDTSPYVFKIREEVGTEEEAEEKKEEQDQFENGSNPQLIINSLIILIIFAII
ncbi:unnamed protein product [Candida verbasci]|uniref:Uncharacterized protein n=1 Tax=Candida verbasci TaxID=1227364 RepID=A0A9W4TWZ8_9ASCO|nr:unnamed protein product [Candida verbasci]